MAGFNRDFDGDGDAPVFDGGEEETEVESSNLPMLIVAVILVLAAFGGVVWVAYHNGVVRGRGEVQAQTVMAQAAEEPAATTTDGALPDTPKPVKAYQQKAGDAAPASAPAPAPVATKPPAQLMPDPAPTPPRTAPAMVKPAAPAPVAAKPAPPKPAPKPAAASNQAVAGGYVLQIGAYKSESEAEAAWKSFRGKHAGLLSGYGSHIQQADLGPRGMWYRLRIAGFADKNAAVALCDKLKAEGGACFPGK